ncbi:hypothetical protein BAE44_0008135 [Dichanthelium oligosanthes]|uniref:DC1 domain-containing protein n=1 Tax=Dichanthelium oligosanthes TaxID=888268 RepID=A0A1E5W0C7_9POAL|nr:hypothetical protein BAE44_0008135 [Dichanthelium oligosanthes]
MAAPISHFLHPDHELKLRDDYHIPHSCDLCGEKLAGSGYSCHRRLCGFDLHQECAMYPETLSSFFVHPWHDLTLSRTADDGGSPARVCHVCRQDVPAGVFLYRCAPCGFDMHPRCSRLPQTVRSELHPEHSLAAVAGMGTCAACGKPCYVWVYRCGPCNVDLHIDCLHGARPSNGMGAGGGAGGQAGASQGAELVGSIVGAGAVLINMLESNR